jgi:uncharacterized protein YbaP (TraB family)
MLWKTDDAELAYTNALRVTFEHDITAAPDPSLIENTLGNLLSRQVPAAVFVNAAREWVNIGLAPERLEQLQPWIAAMAIGSRLAAQRGIIESNGMDRLSWQRTEQEGKTRTTLSAS